MTGDTSYGNFLPGVHLVTRFGENSNLRAAVTRTLSRPNFSDLAPFELILEEDQEIVRGNPELEVTRAWNFDLMAEHYMESVGIVSAGFFYKDITDNIFPFVSEELIGDEEFEVLQPVNGEDAHVTGIELVYQNQLRFLPSPFDGVGVYANYTYTDSEAIFLGRTATLPGQSTHTGNFAISYEKYGFSGRLSFNFHGGYLSEVGEDATQDIYIDDHVQMDFAASQRITSKLRGYVEMINVNDEPFRRYIGVEDRPVQREFYSWWITFGVRLDY